MVGQPPIFGEISAGANILAKLEVSLEMEFELELELGTVIGFQFFSRSGNSRGPFGFNILTPHSFSLRKLVLFEIIIDSISNRLAKVC
jgi:hypothetical protein